MSPSMMPYQKQDKKKKVYYTKNAPSSHFHLLKKI